MPEIVNSYIKYAYYLLGLLLFVLLTVLAVKTGKIKKAVKQCTDGINSIEDKTKAVKQKTEYLKRSFATSWLFFIEIIAMIELIKIIIRDYKATPKEKRSMIKSAAHAIIRKPHVAKIAFRK